MRDENEATKKLEQIKADILSSNICPDLAQTATQLVMGHGNASARVVFIGEAPGKNEDLQGIPFVGAAGKLLEEMLAQAGMSREDVYITNIVKYRPPNNRDPLPDEKASFLPYLKRELEVIRPIVIATLGRHSMEFFLPGKRISEIHGQPKRIKIRFGNKEDQDSLGASAVQGEGEQRTDSYGIYEEGVAESSTQQRAANDSGVSSSVREQVVMSVVILPLFHPAAALYNGGMRQTLFDDFAGLPEIIKQIEQ